MTAYRSRVRALFLASSLAALTLALPAMAEEAKPASQAEETPETIVITGEVALMPDGVTPTGSRLGLDVREIPAALDILTQERFLERGTRTTTEALNGAPGITAVDTGGSPGTLSMRGFGSNAVSTNYDGVHQPSTMIARNYDSFAFERVEVLKGPASVLYGEGSLGGAVNFVPKKPELDKARFTGLSQWGSRDTFRIAADANVPLSDKVGIRGVVSWAGSDGYIDRTQSRTLTSNLGLTFKPSEDVTMFFAAEYFVNNNGPTYWGTPLVPSNLAGETTGIATAPNSMVVDKALRDINYQYSDGLVRSDSTWLRSQITWTINDVWTLSNDLSYNNSDRLWQDAESYAYNATTKRINRQPFLIRNLLDFWNERLMLNADSTIAGMRNRFMIGAEHTENNHNSIRRFGSNTPTDLTNSTPGTFPVINAVNFPGAGNFADSAAKIKINAVFGEDALNLTEKLLLVVGGRYEDMKLDRTVKDFNLGTTTNFSRTYNPFSFRAGLVYDLAKKTQVYAQYNQAAAPVGTLVLLSPTNSVFKLTKGKSAEVGVKSSFLHNRVDLTVSAYWIQQTDIITRDPSNPNADPIQGGTQSSRGVEVALAAALTRDLRIDANFATLDARFDKLIETGNANRAGNTPTNTPETIFNVFASYNVDGSPLKITAGLKRSSHIYGNTANTVLIQGYTVFDASIGYAFKFGDITLRGRNLGDAFYAEWGGSSTVYLAAPRSLDLTFRTKF